MPELPEVETVRRHLAPRMEGRAVASLEILDPRWCTPEPPAALVDAVVGARVEALRRRGKHLIAALSDERYLLMHLRMTGAMLVDPPDEPPHTRVRIGLDDGARVLFVDPRRFGTGTLVLGAAALEAYFAARLGPEPFDPSVTGAWLRALARGRRASVKAFLLDQRMLAGVGNIYADEALFRAGIHPARAAGSLTRGQWETLAGTVRDALQAGIDAHGASIDDFRDPDGVRGTFQDEFLVHRREGEPCPRCGTAVHKLVVAQRGTYVCPRCQRAPRGAPRSTPRAAPTGVPNGRR